MIRQMLRILKIFGRFLSRFLTLPPNVSVSLGAPLEGMPNADWVFSVGANKKRAHYVQFCLQQIKSMLSPCTKRDLAKAYKLESS